MTDFLKTPCTAFAGMKRIAQGALVDVALAVKRAEPFEPGAPALTFEDATGRVVDLDLRGGTADIVTRLADRAGTRPSTTQKPRGRGRPKLGVVAREVTLLPRHWEWLAAQPGGASQALRKLVDQARREDGGQTDAKQAAERAYRFMSAIAGDLPCFEEASRALFRGDWDSLRQQMQPWPADVQDHVLKLAGGQSQML